MNCPHVHTNEQFCLTWCADCGAIRYPEASGWTLPKFKIDALSTFEQLERAVMSCPHTNTDDQYELTWCTDCGAIRYREAQQWRCPKFQLDAISRITVIVRGVDVVCANWQDVDALIARYGKPE